MPQSGAWDKSRLTYGLDPSLCLTIVEGRSEMTTGGAKFPPKYRWRGLSLERCSDAAIERQLWALSHLLDVAAPILPSARSLTD